VRITIEERQTDTRSSCQAALALRSTTITLAGPLGTRELLGCAVGPCRRFTLAGHARASGGPAGGAVLEGVAELHHGGTSVSSTRLQHGGRYTFSVPAGDYELSYPGAPGCTVAVHISADTNADLNCHIK
jgi:hypothetical protein